MEAKFIKYPGKRSFQVSLSSSSWDETETIRRHKERILIYSYFTYVCMSTICCFMDISVVILPLNINNSPLVLMDSSHLKSQDSGCWGKRIITLMPAWDICLIAQKMFRMETAVLTTTKGCKERLKPCLWSAEKMEKYIGLASSANSSL